jgi:hypothetical protein
MKGEVERQMSNNEEMCFFLASRSMLNYLCIQNIIDINIMFDRWKVKL